MSFVLAALMFVFSACWNIVQQADTLRSAGRYRAAESLYRQALVFAGPVGTQAAVILNALGVVLLDEGRYAEAEEPFLRALEIRKSRLGLRHRDTLVVANNLASAYLAQGHPGRAASILTNAIEAGVPSLSPRDLLLFRRNLAYAHLQGGDIARAEPIVRSNLAAVKELFGLNDINTAVELNNMAEVLRLSGRRSEAKALLLEALQIFDRAGAENHPLKALCKKNLASLDPTK